MRTSVTHIGRAVPMAFRGTARAVWRGAFAVDAGASTELGVDALIVTVVREDVPMTAASLRLTTGPGFEFGPAGVRAGDVVAFDDGTLVVSSAAGDRTLVAATRGAGRFEGLATALPTTPDPAVLEWMERVARSRRDGAAGHNDLARRAGALCDGHLADLARSVAADDPRAAHRSARALVGLGPGLTPSGDDVLCGFLLGCALRGAARSIAAHEVRAVAASASGRTTDVSAVHLALAARGRFGESLLGAGEALSGTGRRFDELVDGCLAQGATSGADALLGLVAGARLPATEPLAANA